MNYSKQREIILDTLKNNVVHPTAEYIYEILKKEDSKISLATLYRNLNQLAENGIIKKIDGLESSSHYDHNTHAHYHFICDNCKKVFDVSCGIAPDIVKKIEDETGFIVSSHDIIIHGICKNCKN
ncbi:transcriptional repressor [Spirochaetes bacterium]|uniref:Transcriptional repressor n=1 Tax=Candidatus Scatousia excrementipullorum TaxID=2840936 RepID=A0A9D9H0J0_9BACT|nr:transcriptional repressor [Candidatus Scatousia excrementipullorum]